MRITNLGSSSEGNSFVIQFEGYKPFMIECGFDITEMQKRLLRNGEDLNEIDDIFITHAHKDHSICAKTMSRRGKRILASIYTLERLKLAEGLKNVKLEHFKPFELYEGLSVIPFEVQHDIEGSLGFAFISKKESLLFVIDSKKVLLDDETLKKFKFQNIMIECNYDHTTAHIAHNSYLKTGKIQMARHLERVFRSHRSLHGCLELLSKLDLSNTKDIFLTHLSEKNSAPIKFISEVKQKTGIRPHICFARGGIS